MKKSILIALAAITFIGGSFINLKEPVQATSSVNSAVNDINVPTDPWGRAIRTTKLPKNYKDFPYILKDIPNEMYELKRTFIGITYSTVEVLEQPWYSKKVMDKWVSYAEQYGNQILNIDYQTIDRSWMTKLTDVMNSNQHLRKNAMKYVTAAKKNKVKIQGSIKAEPSIVIYDDGTIYVRAYFKFKVTNYKDKNGTIFFDYWAKTSQVTKNVEYEGYSDIPFNLNIYKGSMSDSKVSLIASIFQYATFKKVQ